MIRAALGAQRGVLRTARLRHPHVGAAYLPLVGPSGHSQLQAPLKSFASSEASSSSASPPPPASGASATLNEPPPPASSLGNDPPPPAQGASGEANGPPPPASSPSSDPPPPASGHTAQSTSPPPPATEQADSAVALSCGGFFFALDPNIGLWNDKVNPTWRFTFTDSRTQVKQRIPYAFTIQHRGPHAELAVRFQFGYVHSSAEFSAIPETFYVDSGWEATVPLPLSCVRLCHTVVRAGSQAEPKLATVYCVDCAFGFSAGFQAAVSGAGIKGTPELTWRNEVAMVFFVCACLWGAYSLVTMPSTWQELFEELSREDDELSLAFVAMDVDGDGYITQEDLRNFVRQLPAAAGGNDLNADELFRALDTTGSGRVNFDQFCEFIETAQGALENMQRLPGGRGLDQGLAAGMPYQKDPFGVGGFAPGLGPVLPTQGSLIGSVMPMASTLPPGSMRPRGQS